MLKVTQGNLVANENQKFAVIVSRFNELIGSKLLSGSIDCLTRHKVDEKNIEVIWVPGSYEIPLVAKRIAKSGNFSAIICLGAVIRGATPHFDYVSAEVSKGIASVSLETDVPISFGVLTTDTIEQAIERAGTKAGNKGWDSALGAIEMANLFEQI